MVKSHLARGFATSAKSNFNVAVLGAGGESSEEASVESWER